MPDALTPPYTDRIIKQPPTHTNGREEHTSQHRVTWSRAHSHSLSLSGTWKRDWELSRPTVCLLLSRALASSARLARPALFRLAQTGMRIKRSGRGAGRHGGLGMRSVLPLFSEPTNHMSSGACQHINYSKNIIRR